MRGMCFADAGAESKHMHAAIYLLADPGLRMFRAVEGFCEVSEMQQKHWRVPGLTLAEASRSR